MSYEKIKYKYAGEMKGVNGTGNSFLFLDEVQKKKKKKMNSKEMLRKIKFDGQKRN